MIFFIILFTMALTELTKPTSLYKWSALWYDKIFVDVEGITLLNVGVPRFKASIVCTFIKLLLDFSIHTLLKKESFYKCESFFFFFLTHMITIIHYSRTIRMVLENVNYELCKENHWNRKLKWDQAAFPEVHRSTRFLHFGCPVKTTSKALLWQKWIFIPFRISDV